MKEREREGEIERERECETDRKIDREMVERGRESADLNGALPLTVRRGPQAEEPLSVRPAILLLFCLSVSLPLSLFPFIHRFAWFRY